MPVSAALKHYTHTYLSNDMDAMYYSAVISLLKFTSYLVYQISSSGRFYAHYILSDILYSIISQN